MKRLSIFLCALATAFSFAANRPNPLRFLPPPPQKGTVHYSADSLQYEWGKSVRNTLRGDSAIVHAKDKPKDMLKMFGSVIGIKLDKEKYPATAELVKYVRKEAKESIQETKKKYARHRPYQDFGEKTPTPEDESLTDFSSFPSSHATRAWTVALLFAMLVPEHQNEILKLGYEMGQSRVILGFHYQSDVDAARLAGSAAFANLCSRPEFWQMVEKAKAELGREK